MARNLAVYPKALIDGDVWTLIVKIKDDDTGQSTKTVYTAPAGVTVSTPLRLLKLGFDLVVADTDTDQDVVDALVVDDIKPGAQTETVWGNWQERAEGIIGGLVDGYTPSDFWGAWSASDTTAVRNDAKRALITQRGWTVPAGSIHQHEGDGTVTVDG